MLERDVKVLGDVVVARHGLQEPRRHLVGVGVEEAEPAETGQVYAATQAGFERWFKDQVRAVTGIDQDNQPLGPPTEILLDFALAPPDAVQEG